MMKLKSVVIILLVFTQMACNKKGDDDLGSNDVDTSESSNLDPLIIEKALFTEPVLVKARRKSTVIQENLVKYINHTPKGADIYMSIFKFYDPLIVSAAEDAAKRGVNVKVLIDSSETKQGGSRDANKLTFAKLQYAFSHNPSNSEVIGINNQITSSAINHEKYVLFSEIIFPSKGVAKNVVFNASYNFIESSATRANDAVVMTNESLYNIFVDHWNDLAAHADKNMKDYEYTVEDVGDSLTAFFFPRRSGGSWDGSKTIVEQLDGLTNLSEDTICVLMAGWSGARGLDIAKKLTSLYSQGATVDVIASSITAAATRTELSKLKPPRGHLTIVNFNHSKTVLIKGFWKGEKQTIILTGSKNFYTGGLQYSNNVLLRLKNSALFNDYWNNFEAIKP